MLAPTTSRNRFTCAKLHQLPIAAFRPRRYQRCPCESDSLPREQGEDGDKHRLGLPASLGKQKTIVHSCARSLKFSESLFYRRTSCCDDEAFRFRKGLRRSSQQIRVLESRLMRRRDCQHRRTRSDHQCLLQRLRVEQKSDRQPQFL